MAANLALDPHGLGTTDADGDPSTNMQSSNKSALRAAASLKTDAKPLETTGGQTFSSTLGAAASEAANQTARSAAQAAAHRPARPAQTAPATAQVAVHIVRAVADGVSRFNVQLQPAELGRVEVKMEISRDGAVRAMVVADRQETVDQLQRDSRALERALQEAGLKADSQNLHFSLRGGQNGHAMSENRTSIGNSGNGEADITEVSESALAVHWSNVAGSTGALDIRV
jgi:flagellar hook-length control protein FliK